MDLGLSGRRPIVTAASHGIGLAIADTLAGEGAAVAICARTEATLREAAAMLRRHGGALHIPASGRGRGRG